MRHPDEWIVRDAKVRLITVDRPGYGESDFLPGRSFLDWPEDVSQLADQLKVPEFQIIAFSGGGPYALATGLRLAARVQSITLMSSVGPLNQCASDHRNGLVRLVFRTGLCAPWLLHLGVKVAVAKARKNFDRSFDWAAARLPECDREVILRPGIRAVFQESLTEAFRNGSSAFIWEVRLLTQTWGFPLSEVQQPIGLWHGDLDVFANGRALASLLPSCQPTFFPEGHLLFFNHWSEILRQLQEF